MRTVLSYGDHHDWRVDIWNYETIEYTLPEFWLSALINGDWEPYTKEEKAQIKEFLAQHDTTLLSEFGVIEGHWAADDNEAVFFHQHDATEFGVLACNCVGIKWLQPRYTTNKSPYDDVVEYHFVVPRGLAKLLRETGRDGKVNYTGNSRITNWNNWFHWQVSRKFYNGPHGSWRVHTQALRDKKDHHGIKMGFPPGDCYRVVWQQQINK
jgi:hypothetical protein